MRHLIITICFITLIASGYSQVVTDTGYIVKIGDQAPDISLQLTTGEIIHLSELKGKVVVLQFTASWCSVCRKEMPYLENEVWIPNQDKNFVLIGVDYDEPIQKVIAFKEQMKITYSMALDPGAEIFSRFAYKRSGVTRNVVIDKNGNIVFLTRLFDKTEFEAMKSKIGDLLNENP